MDLKGKCPSNTQEGRAVYSRHGAGCVLMIMEQWLSDGYNSTSLLNFKDPFTSTWLNDKTTLSGWQSKLYDLCFTWDLKWSHMAGKRQSRARTKTPISRVFFLKLLITQEHVQKPKPIYLDVFFLKIGFLSFKIGFLLKILYLLKKAR